MPPGTSTPDLNESVTATQQINGGAITNLTLDEPTQYIPRALEDLTYDLDGNLLTDGRWTYTWVLA